MKVLWILLIGAIVIIGAFVTLNMMTSRPNPVAQVVAPINPIPQFIASKNGPIKVTLKIVDEQGQPMKGVMVTATSSQITPVLKRKDTVQRNTVDASYSIDEPSCNVLSLSLIREGYDANRMDFVYSQPRSDVHQVGLKHVYDVIAVMKKMGKLGIMHRFHQWVSWSKTEGLQVMDVTLQGKNGKPDNVKTLKKIKNINDLTTLSRIYLEVTPSKEKKPAFIRFNQLASPIDLDVSLVMDDGTDQCGFIPFDDTAITDRLVAVALQRPHEPSYYEMVETMKKRGLNERESIIIGGLKESIRYAALKAMTKAPETGYRKRIPITSELFAKSHPICFYFKLNGNYGKGAIIHASYSEKENNIEASVEFYMELDGTTNLVTLD